MSVRASRPAPALARRLQLALFAASLAGAAALPGCILLGPRQDRHGAEALDSDRFLAGAWLGSWPGDGNPVIDRFEDETGARLDLVDVYLDWFTPFDNVSHALAHIASRGAVPVLTWEAQTVTTQDILSGTRMLPLRDGRRLPIDAYLAEFAEGVCDAAGVAGQPILLRVLHEMNGHWFAWGISHEDAKGNRPNSDASYKQAWTTIHGAFSSRCGHDVRFVWAINHASVGDGATFMGAYPGDDLVDYVGLDGYNWGDQADWGWQGVDTIFRTAYCAVVAATDKPILIAETASTELGGDKAAWIRDLYGRTATFAQLRGIVWFNDAKHEVETGGELDWPVDSSPEALQAYKDGVLAAAQRDPATQGADPC